MGKLLNRITECSNHPDGERLTVTTNVYEDKLTIGFYSTRKGTTNVEVSKALAKDLADALGLDGVAVTTATQFAIGLLLANHVGYPRCTEFVKEE